MKEIIFQSHPEVIIGNTLRGHYPGVIQPVQCMGWPFGYAVLGSGLTPHRSHVAPCPRSSCSLPQAGQRVRPSFDVADVTPFMLFSLYRFVIASHEGASFFGRDCTARLLSNHSSKLRG